MMHLMLKKLVWIECTLLGVSPNDGIVSDVLTNFRNIPIYLRMAVYLNSAMVFFLSWIEIALSPKSRFSGHDNRLRLEHLLARRLFSTFFRLFRGILFMSIGQEFRRIYNLNKAS